jgi:hypothetical protein
MCLLPKNTLGRILLRMSGDIGLHPKSYMQPNQASYTTHRSQEMFLFMDEGIELGSTSSPDDLPKDVFKAIKRMLRVPSELGSPIKVKRPYLTLTKIFLHEILCI